jgi:hypothetical protein
MSEPLTVGKVVDPGAPQATAANSPDWASAFKYSHADRDAETAAFLGGGVYFDSLFVPPPVPGVITQLEMLGSPFLSGDSAELKDIVLAVYLLISRSPDAMNSETIDTDLHKISVQLQTVDNPAAELTPMFNLMQRGFELLPPSPLTPGGHDQRHYDAIWLSECVYIGNQMSNKSDADIIWQTPVAAIGFYAAQLARQNGVKGVGRKIDPAAALALLPRNRKKKKE